MGVVCARACVRECKSTPEAIITSGMMWCDIDWLTKFYSCYMATAVGIVDGRGLRIVKTIVIRIS